MSRYDDDIDDWAEPDIWHDTPTVSEYLRDEADAADDARRSDERRHRIGPEPGERAPDTTEEHAARVALLD